MRSCSYEQDRTESLPFDHPVSTLFALGAKLKLPAHVTPPGDYSFVEI